MIHIKLKNVSVLYGKKFRHNQNYTMVFYKLIDAVDENTSEDDIKKLISDKYSKKVYLTKKSKLEIVSNKYKDNKTS